MFNSYQNSITPYLILRLLAGITGINGFITCLAFAPAVFLQIKEEWLTKLSKF